MVCGESNNVSDTLSRDWHCNEEELTFILRSHFPEQMPESFRISQLPREINLWLMISLLRQLPVSKQLREHHTTTGLEPEGGLAAILQVRWMQRPLH